MRIAVLGAGVLGRHLTKTTVYASRLFTTDVTDAAALLRDLSEYEPDYVINTAAKTGVDWCENHAAEALRVNAIGAGTAAYVSAGIGAHFVQISTDYVFSGQSSSGYKDTDEPAPINVYGFSKLYGERAVAALGPKKSTIIRVGWLYGENYPKCAPMLAANASDEEWVRGDIKGRHRAYVWNDLRGTPTYVRRLAYEILSQLQFCPEDKQILHFAPNEEPTTWFDFLVNVYPNIQPVPSYKTPLKAQRPKRGGLISSYVNAESSYREQLLSFQKYFELSQRYSPEG